MRWQKKTVRAVNLSSGASLGDRVRVADQGHTRIMGLLGERGLEAGDGLLIIPSQGVHTFGMVFPIDVVILDGNWKVMAVREHLRPFRITRIFFAAAAVLELPAGTVAATKIKIGDSLDFVRVDMTESKSTV